MSKERDPIAIDESLGSAKRYATWQDAYDAGRGRPIDQAQEEVITLAAEVERYRRLFGGFQLECCDDWRCAEDHARKAGEVIGELRAELQRVRADLDQGAKDYCALQDRSDEWQVRAHNAEAELQRFRAAQSTERYIALRSEGECVGFTSKANYERMGAEQRQTFVDGAELVEFDGPRYPGGDDEIDMVFAEVKRLANKAAAQPPADDDWGLSIADARFQPRPAQPPAASLVEDCGECGHRVDAGECPDCGPLEDASPVDGASSSIDKMLADDANGFKLNPQEAADLCAEVRRLREELETERMRLAVCGVAARGALAGREAKYESDSLKATQKLLSDRDRLAQQVEFQKTNVRHWREECGKVNAQARASRDHRERAEKAEADCARWQECADKLLVQLSQREEQLRTALDAGEAAELRIVELRQDNARLGQQVNDLNEQLVSVRVARDRVVGQLANIADAWNGWANGDRANAEAALKAVGDALDEPF